jgi:hypothetical protein
MAMHNTNSLLKYIVPVVLVILFLLWILSFIHHPEKRVILKEIAFKNSAAQDSAAESLDTLTAELSETKQQISSVSKNDEILKKQNKDLLEKLSQKQTNDSSQLSADVEQLKSQFQAVMQTKTQDNGASPPEQQAITTVTDLTPRAVIKNTENDTFNTGKSEIKAVAYYTIPANATSVKDKLMTALVGRIPIKGVVTDPYPFKIVISDDNLAANGLRIPHLLQMIVSGYCEGDLNLVSVRGWVTSLTFVFDDGTISTTTSNDNDIGNFTKSNSLGYLSDKYGNPFIRGKLITNAPAYLTGNVALGAATGAANAYAQAQVSNSNSVFGNSATVTGSQGKFVAGEALSGSANAVQQWWSDRVGQSFDAVYVAPADEKGEYVEIAVNFAKEIHIDYDTKGRKLNYDHQNTSLESQLD